MGACQASGGNIVTDAFGVVAMVAMTPLITIQVLGAIYRMQELRAEADIPEVEEIPIIPLENFGDYDIIEL